MNHVVINPTQVQGFYDSLDIDPNNGTGSFIVGGERVSFSEKTLRGLMGLGKACPGPEAHFVPSSGFGIEGEELDDLFCRIINGKTPNANDRVTHVLFHTGAMAHYFISRMVVPRQEKKSIVQTIDYVPLLDAFLKPRKINLARIDLEHMAKCTRKNHALPFPGLIKALLIKNEAYKVENEVSLGMHWDERLGFKEIRHDKELPPVLKQQEKERKEAGKKKKEEETLGKAEEKRLRQEALRKEAEDERLRQEVVVAADLKGKSVASQENAPLSEEEQRVRAEELARLE